MATREEFYMTEPNEEVPFGQKLLDNPIALLIIGILVMFVFYTGWGLIEVMILPEATLP